MSFPEIKKKLGFGCMRLKMINDKVDYEEFNKMIDEFINAGFNYFDTAHGYINGMSETSIRDCLAARYDRGEYVLANKLSAWFFNGEDEIIPLFEKQLELCGVEYFDFYLFHALNKDNYQKHKRCNSFKIVEELKNEGKIKHIAMSFHDSAEVLELILSEQPSIEVVQLQFNYLDYNNPTVQSKACYDIAVKYGKKVIVMEPVKGGALVNLPKKAEEIFKSLSDNSFASYALRFVTSFSDVIMVLSGMGNMEMMKDNINTMTEPIPFSDEEYKAVEKVREIILETNQIQCTKCNYCADVCKKNIPISEIFSVYNNYLAAKISRDDTKSKLPDGGNEKFGCIKCGECEKVCPQGILIRENFDKLHSDMCF